MDETDLGASGTGARLEGVELPVPVEIRTIGADELEARYVNLATLGYDRAALYLTLSQFPPPTITGPEDAHRVSEQGFVPAKAIARFALTPLMVEELITLFQNQLDNYNRSHRSNDGQATEQASE